MNKNGNLLNKIVILRVIMVLYKNNLLFLRIIILYILDHYFKKIERETY